MTRPLKSGSLTAMTDSSAKPDHRPTTCEACGASMLPMYRRRFCEACQVRRELPRLVKVQSARKCSSCGGAYFPFRNNHSQCGRCALGTPNQSRWPACPSCGESWRPAPGLGDTPEAQRICIVCVTKSKPNQRRYLHALNEG